MRLELSEIIYGVVDEEKGCLVALFKDPVYAKQFADTAPRFKAYTVDRNDWTSANLSWDAAEELE